MKNLTQECQSRFELGLSDSEAPGLLDQGDAGLFHNPSCPLKAVCSCRAVRCEGSALEKLA